VRRCVVAVRLGAVSCGISEVRSSKIRLCRGKVRHCVVKWQLCVVLCSIVKFCLGNIR
jgi:hypothetical protein